MLLTAYSYKDKLLEPTMKTKPSLLLKSGECLVGMRLVPRRGIFGKNAISLSKPGFISKSGIYLVCSFL